MQALQWTVDITRMRSKRVTNKYPENRSGMDDGLHVQLEKMEAAA